MKFKQNIENKLKSFSKADVIILFILIVGFIVRIFGIQDMPNALNCDEASSAYEAFSILNYGIDRTRK